jgi:mannose-6-phosphate isomerase-like protein (cupin superfamily)
MKALFAVAALDELDAIPVSHGLVWRPVRRRFDLRGFGVNAYTADEVGGQVVEDHTEGQYGHEELYVVVRGRATFTLDGTDVDAPAGTAVHLADPQVRRVAHAQTEDAAVLALGGRAGEPFRISAWETSFAAIPAMRAERWDEALALYGEALAIQPDDGRLVYNLACTEARAGRHLDALLHLQRAVELLPEAARWAQTDSDFAAIHGEPGFPPPPPPAGPAPALPEPAERPVPGWRAVHLDELPRRDEWIPLRAELGFGPVGVNAWLGDADGDEAIGAHDELDSGHEELYVVLRGHATFRIDGREVDAPAGTLVAVAPQATRSATAAAPRTAILAVGAQPGVAYEPREWETRALSDAPAGQPDAGGEPA